MAAKQIGVIHSCTNMTTRGLLTFDNVAQCSDEEMIAGARRLFDSESPLLDGISSGRKREFRLRPTGDSAGRIVYLCLRKQTENNLPRGI